MYICTFRLALNRYIEKHAHDCREFSASNHRSKPSDRNTTGNCGLMMTDGKRRLYFNCSLRRESCAVPFMPFH